MAKVLKESCGGGGSGNLPRHGKDFGQKIDIDIDARGGTVGKLVNVYQFVCNIFFVQTVISFFGLRKY